MRRLFVAFVVLLLASACGGSPTKPAPQMPAANLVGRGNMTFTCTFGSCFFQGEGVNNGPGCAINVRGVSRLLNTAGTEVGRAEWTLAATRRIQAGESFLYDGCCYTQASVNIPGSYRTEFSWDNTGC
jgi:hypothetical protein